jgi:hypothetical protein
LPPFATTNLAGTPQPGGADAQTRRRPAARTPGDERLADLRSKRSPPSLELRPLDGIGAELDRAGVGAVGGVAVAAAA